MKKKFNILKLAPAARNFEEAVEFVRLAEDENVKFAVANPYRFAQSFRAFRQFLEEGRLEEVFLITAFLQCRRRKSLWLAKRPEIGRRRSAAVRLLPDN